MSSIPFRLPADLRRFARSLAAFALLILPPLAVGEAYVRSQPNPAKSKHAFLTARSAEVETLILGSSHTYYGLIADTLHPAAYNAAQVSQTYSYDYFVLTAYPFPRLRTVVLPLSDFSLYEELEGGPEWYLATRYRLYMDCPRHSRFGLYGFEFTAFKVFVEKLKQLWRPRRMHWSERGTGLEYTLENRAAAWDNGADRAAVNRHLDFARLAEKGEPWLARIAAWCEARNVRLVLLSTPLRPSYRAAQLPAQTADTEARATRLLRRYPRTVRRIDLRDDPRFGATDFYDADHLSLQGAAKLSRLLRRYLAQ